MCAPAAVWVLYSEYAVTAIPIDGNGIDRAMNPKTCSVLLVLLGVAGLVVKGHYAGPFEDIVHNHGGNVSASFAVYFVVGITTSGWKYGKLLTAGIALLVVELFEATNGFGVMSNVYDPADFVANALGVGLALVVDILASRTAPRTPTGRSRVIQRCRT